MRSSGCSSLFFRIKPQSMYMSQANPYAVATTEATTAAAVHAAALELPPEDPSADQLDELSTDGWD